MSDILVGNNRNMYEIFTYLHLFQLSKSDFCLWIIAGGEYC